MAPFEHNKPVTLEFVNDNVVSFRNHCRKQFDELDTKIWLKHQEIKRILIWTLIAVLALHILIVTCIVSLDYIRREKLSQKKIEPIEPRVIWQATDQHKPHWKN